ncbi:MAG: penicillin acylase family protein [Saprospiraceae bacterium]|nr:penicillin acylase family protein [Saprospiraceae bacterium]
MRLIRFLFAFLPLAGLVWALSVPLKAGDKTLPALGRFFSPFSGFWQNAEPANGRNAVPLQAKLPALKGPVEVVWDDMMVPHIFAGDPNDAAMVQGYIHASHRLFQMDIVSRQTAGRLSEVIGPRTLEADRLIRRRGLPWAVERNMKSLQQSPRTMQLLEAYAAGVNAYIDQLNPATLPLEYKLMNFEPEHWSPERTLFVVANMIDALNNRDNDLAATNSLAVFGRDTFNYLYPSWNAKQTPIIPDTGQWADIQPLVRPETVSGQTAPGSAPPERSELSPNRDLNGSNNWAVAGSRTRSGAPILCNDTHLPLRLPHVWYVQQIQTPQFNSYGIVVPGVPLMAIGFNNDMAWGFTNCSHEVADWYRLQWTDGGKTTYLLDGQPRKAELRVEEIRVKGAPAVRDTVRYTDWGPVVYDQPDHPLHDCAYRYVAHDPMKPESLYEFLNISSARNYDDYRKAIPGLEALSQNVAFASRNGAIALTVQGKFPVRQNGQGRFVQDGTAWANNWAGYIPASQLPAMRNPSRGFVYSANQHSTPPTYPYYYLGNFDHSRGRRIYQRLENMRDITIDSMKSIQLDNYSQRAADGLHALLRRVKREQLNDSEKKWLSALEQWDARYQPDQIAPSLFEMWFDSTYFHTWDEMENLRRQKTAVLYPEHWRFCELLESDSASVFFDELSTPQREEAGDIVTAGFHKMAARAEKMPSDSLQWHTFKGFVIKHLAMLDAFSRLDVSVGGSRNSPNAISTNHGPTWRMIVEMGAPIRALGVYPGGQSGNPGSRYYDNFVDAWARGDYFDLVFLSQSDEQNPRILARQTFTPGS